MNAHVAEINRDGRAHVAEQIRALGEWFHNIDFGGVQTAPEHFLGDFPRVKWEQFQDAIPADLRGKTGTRYRL